MPDLNDLPHRVATIKNRRGLDLFIRFNGDSTNAKPLAVVSHGLSDVHDSAPLRAIARGLITAGYNVITFDATNSWGRSGGVAANATLTASYEDLIDVVKWAQDQPGYQEPMVLAGHSMGAAASLRFAFDQPRLVRRLILVSPVVAGEVLAQRLPRPVRELWRLADQLPEPGQKGKRYRYDLLRDGLNYNGPQLASGIHQPTTIISGAQDRIIRPRDVELLHDAFQDGVADLVMVDDADHGFTGVTDRLEAIVAESIVDKQTLI